MNEEIRMPNAIFSDMSKWVESKELKSVQHKEFVYSFYWYITYLWRFAKHAEVEVNQKKTKQLLGYNPVEKRIDYIIRRNGLLDQNEYTSSTRDFPIGWYFKNGNLNFSMFNSMSDVHKKYLLNDTNPNRVFKQPLKHMGVNSGTGLFWDSTETHPVSYKAFVNCMNNKNLKAGGFYLYGVLEYLKETSETFTFTNELLSELTGWSIKKITEYKLELSDAGLLHSFLMDASSKGERRIYDFLLKKKIVNIPEYSFPDLKGVGDNPLRFDYALFNDNHELILLIEYDGEHHYQSVDYTGMSEDGGAWYLEKTRLHDIAKNRFCQRNRIPLLRIPYWEFDNIEKLILSKLNEISKPPSLVDMLVRKSKKKVE